MAGTFVHLVGVRPWCHTVGKMVDVGRKRLGVRMQVERRLESCDHTEVATEVLVCHLRSSLES